TDTASVNTHTALLAAEASSIANAPSSTRPAGDRPAGLNTNTGTAGSLSNTGRLEGQRLAVKAASLNGRGTLLGVDALTLAITGAAANDAGGQWLSGGALGVSAATLDNGGEMQGDTLALRAGQITNLGRCS
ncbi:hypothetical protein, partial [Dickeya sp. DW 0440]|uniref:hypothetical protein n=1 Tax=Dickeya sp. DW 0440 TaxID=1225785 RepID=UPI000552ABC0